MKRLSLCLLLSLLTACATLRPEERYWIKPGAGYVSDDAVSLLHYGNYVRDLGSTEREREIERQRHAHVRDKSDFRRLQYAIALGTAPASAQERRLALQLIEPMRDGQGHASSLAALAEMLEAHLLSLRRADELERKLDALKDIERSLLPRESLPASRTRSPARGKP